MNLRMLLSSFFFAVCIVCLSSNSIYAQDARPTRPPNAIISGGGYTYRLTDQDFANTPSWNPEEAEPPLSVSRAVKVARETLPRFVKSPETWRMQRVILQSTHDDKWYYQVHFLCLGGACREIEDRSFTAIVKMDGTIVEPKKVTIEH